MEKEWTEQDGKGCPICQAGTEGKWRCGCTHTQPWCYNGVDGQHYAPTALPSIERHGTYFMGGLGDLRASISGSRKSHPTPKIQTPDRPARF